MTTFFAKTTVKMLNKTRTFPIKSLIFVLAMPVLPFIVSSCGGELNTKKAIATEDTSPKSYALTLRSPVFLSDAKFTFTDALTGQVILTSLLKSGNDLVVDIPASYKNTLIIATMSANSSTSSYFDPILALAQKTTPAKPVLIGDNQLHTVFQMTTDATVNHFKIDPFTEIAYQRFLVRSDYLEPIDPTSNTTFTLNEAQLSRAMLEVSNVFNVEVKTNADVLTSYLINDIDALKSFLSTSNDTDAIVNYNFVYTLAHIQAEYQRQPSSQPYFQFAKKAGEDMRDGDLDGMNIRGYGQADDKLHINNPMVTDAPINQDPSHYATDSRDLFLYENQTIPREAYALRVENAVNTLFSEYNNTTIITPSYVVQENFIEITTKQQLTPLSKIMINYNGTSLVRLTDSLGNLAVIKLPLTNPSVAPDITLKYTIFTSGLTYAFKTKLNTSQPSTALLGAGNYTQAFGLIDDNKSSLLKADSIRQDPITQKVTITGKAPNLLSTINSIFTDYSIASITPNATDLSFSLESAYPQYPIDQTPTGVTYKKETIEKDGVQQEQYSVSGLALPDAIVTAIWTLPDGSTKKIDQVASSITSIPEQQTNKNSNFTIIYPPSITTAPKLTFGKKIIVLVSNLNVDKKQEVSGTVLNSAYDLVIVTFSDGSIKKLYSDSNGNFKTTSDQMILTTSTTPPASATYINQPKLTQKSRPPFTKYALNADDLKSNSLPRSDISQLIGRYVMPTCNLVISTSGQVTLTVDNKTYINNINNDKYDTLTKKTAGVTGALDDKNNVIKNEYRLNVGTGTTSPYSFIQLLMTDSTIKSATYGTSLTEENPADGALDNKVTCNFY